MSLYCHRMHGVLGGTGPRDQGVLRECHGCRGAGNRVQGMDGPEGIIIQVARPIKQNQLSKSLWSCARCPHIGSLDILIVPFSLVAHAS